MASTLQACIDIALFQNILVPTSAPRQSHGIGLCRLTLRMPPAFAALPSKCPSAKTTKTGRQNFFGGGTHEGTQVCKALNGESPAAKQTPLKAASESAQHEYHHDVSLTVPAPVSQVWELWTDLENAPKWMPWITAVELSSDDGTPAPEGAAGLHGGAALYARPLSKWICSTSGFQIAWTARVTRVTEALSESAPHCALEWATTEGLQSTGRVTFTPAEDGRESTTIDLKIVHSLPPGLARVMDGSALGGLVKATLRSDLERFQQYVIQNRAGAASDSTARQPAQKDHG